MLKCCLVLMLSWVLHELVVLTKGRGKKIYPHEMLELENRPGSVRSDELWSDWAHRGQQEHISRELVGGGTGNGTFSLVAVSSPCPVSALSTKLPVCPSRNPHKWFSFQIRSTEPVNVTLFQKQGWTFGSYEALKVKNSFKNKPRYACLAPCGPGRHFSCFPLLTPFRALSGETGSW